MTLILVLGFIGMFLLVQFLHQPEKWKKKVNKKISVLKLTRVQTQLKEIK